MDYYRCILVAVQTPSHCSTLEVCKMGDIIVKVLQYINASLVPRLLLLFRLHEREGEPGI